MKPRKLSTLKAAEAMRRMSANGQVFHVKYVGFNESTGKSSGIREEKNILLQKGYRRNQSKKADLLMSFYRADTMERRQFYLPLLLEVNGVKIDNR